MKKNDILALEKEKGSVKMTVLNLVVYTYPNDPKCNFASFVTYVDNNDFCIRTELNHDKALQRLQEMHEKFQAPIIIHEYEDFIASGIRVNLP